MKKPAMTGNPKAENPFVVSKVAFVTLGVEAAGIAVPTYHANGLL